MPDQPTVQYGETQIILDPSFPFIDLHRHIEGNVRLETILDLADKHAISVPATNVESLRPHVQVTTSTRDVMAFIAKFELLTAVMADLEACRRIAYENIEDAASEGIDYLELRFSPWFMAATHQLDPIGVVESVLDGVAEGIRDFGMRAKSIGILSRTYGPQVALKELEALLQYPDGIVALDLAGDEINFPPQLFEEHFRQARAVGWQITVHAGEHSDEVGALNIWTAIKELGAVRIGHGIGAWNDLPLMDYMLEHRVAIEGCLTSNVQTSSVKTYADHPLKQFLERGLLASINTDDPGISNIDLAYEYTVAAPAAGLTGKQIQQAQRNALTTAFLSSEEKASLRAKKQNLQGSSE